MATVAPSELQPESQPELHPRLHRQLHRELERQLGQQAELVSVSRDGDRVLRGVAVCAGRVLSFVLNAEEQRLRTRPLFELLRHSRRG
ncbi:MAG: hypothetical protein RLZZ124_830 [Cyanobacteriota bacterium]|jgi:hypothetical protein